MTRQFNVRLPDPTIERINQLSKRYDSQAKVIIAAVAHLHTKEIKMLTYVFNQHGEEIDFDAAVNLMDNNVRETVHDRLAPCSDQIFFDAYTVDHQAKFDEEFEPSKQNPVW